ncbi:hypothetical protein RFI_12077, partial [Reticulomyxa filosa]
NNNNNNNGMNNSGINSEGGLGKDMNAEHIGGMLSSGLKQSQPQKVRMGYLDEEIDINYEYDIFSEEWWMTDEKIVNGGLSAAKIEFLKKLLFASNDDNSNNNSNNNGSGFAKQPFPLLDLKRSNNINQKARQLLSDDNEDFVVIGTIGRQSVGKSSILSYLSGTNGASSSSFSSCDNSVVNENDASGNREWLMAFPTSITDMINDKNGTQGIELVLGDMWSNKSNANDSDGINATGVTGTSSTSASGSGSGSSPTTLNRGNCRTGENRYLWLDCQPLCSSSILMQWTNLGRLQTRLKKSRATMNCKNMWEIEMWKYALFIVCVCHVVVITVDTVIYDPWLFEFLQTLYLLRQCFVCLLYSFFFLKKKKKMLMYMG